MSYDKTKYLLGYKFSQDHIKTFFSAIRGRGAKHGSVIKCHIINPSSNKNCQKNKTRKTAAV